MKLPDYMVSLLTGGGEDHDLLREQLDILKSADVDRFTELAESIIADLRESHRLGARWQKWARAHGLKAEPLPGRKRRKTLEHVEHG
jgi:hypothetical protein